MLAWVLLAALTEVTTGTLWPISRLISLADIPRVLDRFEPIERNLRSDLERRNVWQVAALFERLLLAAVEQPEPELDAVSVWGWLRVWRSFRDGYGGARDKKVREALRQRPALLQGNDNGFSISSSTVTARAFPFGRKRPAFTAAMSCSPETLGETGKQDV